MPPPVADDDQKRRARRRLIGAVALTLLAVILLPLVLEDEPPPAGPLEIHMPPSAVQNPAPASVQAPSLPDTIEFAPPAENTRVDPVEEAPEMAAVKLKSGADDLPKPAMVKPAPVKTESPKKVESAKPQPQPAKPETKAVAKAEQKPAVSAETDYRVQVGVFSDQANVEKLKSRIAALGFKAYTEQVGTSTRVRVGKFSSRAQADEVVSKLKAAGLPAQVVEK